MRAAFSDTEWSPLKEVVVGNVNNFHMRQLDKVFLYIYGHLRNFQEKSELRKTYSISKKYIRERQEDLNALSMVLQKHGAIVHRTHSIVAKKITTPTFSSIQNDCGCVRDMFLVIGNTIIETPPTDRRRYFEGFALKDLFLHYFKHGSNWISAPRTELRDENVDFKDWNKYRSTQFHTLRTIANTFEIAFDGANCLKFGKNILMNVGSKNHELGAHWLQKVLGTTYNVHAVRLTDSHIDGLMMPLDEGTLLVNDYAMHNKYHLLPAFLQKWKRIPVADAYAEFNYPSNHLQLSSFRGMDTNVLAIGSKKVVIRDTAVQTIQRLRDNGFTPVPVKLRHCELFGGGPHCVTLDTLRA